MINIKINGKDVTINTSWRDITYSQFQEIVNFDKEKEPQKFIALVSGVPCITLENIGIQSIEPILNLITFVNDFEILEAYNIVPESLKSFNIGSETWYKLEKAKQAIKSQEKFICAAGSVIKVYTGEDIADKKLTEVWGQVNFFLDQVNKFFEKYKRLSEHEEDPDEFMAGVARFEQFGFFASCVELSRKMGCKYNEVLNMTANEVYQTFLYDFEKADYEKILKQLKTQK